MPVSVHLLSQPEEGRSASSFSLKYPDGTSCLYLFSKLLWVYCSGHARVKANDRADRLAGKAALTSGLLLGRSEVLRSLRHYLRAQSQRYHTFDLLEERGVKEEALDDLP